VDLCHGHHYVLVTVKTGSGVWCCLPVKTKDSNFCSCSRQCLIIHIYILDSHY